MIVKKFKDFVNENITDLLVGKSMDDINKLWSNLPANSLEDLLNYYYENKLPKKYLPTVSQFKKLSENPVERLFFWYNFELPDKYKPSNKDLRNYVMTLDNDDRILTILELSLNFDWLPRNNNGICVFNENLEQSEFSELPISRLPDNFTVNGNVLLYSLDKLPDNLVINGNLTLNDNYLEEIPNTLYVKGDMYCRHNEQKLELPEGAYVGGKFVN